MTTQFDVIDPDYEKEKKIQRKLLLLIVFISSGLFSYPVVQKYYPKWESFVVAQELSLTIYDVRKEAIYKKQPIAVYFKAPNILEYYQVSSCGPQATHKKLKETKLSETYENIEFVSSGALQNNLNSEKPVLSRFCYDPLYGSSLLADGIVQAEIVVAHKQDLLANNSDHFVHIAVQNSSIELEVW